MTQVDPQPEGELPAPHIHEAEGRGSIPPPRSKCGPNEEGEELTPQRIKELRSLDIYERTQDQLLAWGKKRFWWIVVLAGFLAGGSGYTFIKSQFGELTGPAQKLQNETEVNLAIAKHQALDLSAQLARAQDLADKLQPKLEEFRAREAHLESDMRELESRLAASATQGGTLAARQEAFNASMSALEDRVTGLRADIGALSEATSSKDKTLAVLLGSVEDGNVSLAGRIASARALQLRTPLPDRVVAELLDILQKSPIGDGLTPELQDFAHAVAGVLGRASPGTWKQLVGIATSPEVNSYMRLGTAQAVAASRKPLSAEYVAYIGETLGKAPTTASDDYWNSFCLLLGWPDSDFVDTLVRDQAIDILLGLLSNERAPQMSIDILTRFAPQLGQDRAKTIEFALTNLAKRAPALSQPVSEGLRALRGQTRSKGLELQICPTSFRLSDGNNFTSEDPGGEFDISFDVKVDGVNAWSFNPGRQRVAAMATCLDFVFSGKSMGAFPLPDMFSQVEVTASLHLARVKEGGLDYSQERASEVGAFLAASCPKASLSGSMRTDSKALEAASRSGERVPLKRNCEVAWRIDGIRSILITYDVFVRAP